MPHRRPAAEWVLDIFHASQHLAATAANLHSEGTDEASAWLERGRRLARAVLPPRDDRVGGLGVVREGVVERPDRLDYFRRLKTSRSIGSGAVEDLARRLGRGLKVPDLGRCVMNL